MRLTLRYLLAYMDEQLEPADAEKLAAKLEKSEYAKSLLHRIRDVTRRLRLGAPRLDARGMGFDANTVAEYLDNALPDDRVPDFEKICLESDMHLAEVAACHQILSLVLGEPAQVDPASRKRMYGLAANPPARVDKPSPTPQPKSAKEGRARAKRKKVKVPDYLKEPEPPRKRRRLVGVIALALLCGAAVLVMVGPGRLWRSPSRRPGVAAADSGIAQADKAVPNAKGANAKGADGQPLQPAKREAKAARRPTAATADSAGKSKSRPGHPRGRAGSRQLEGSAAAAEQPEPSQEATEPPRPQQAAADEAPVPPTADAAPEGAAPAATPGTADASEAAPAAQPADQPADMLPAGDADAAGVSLGRLILEHDVILRWMPPKAEQQRGEWVRLADRAPVYAGDLLLVLPHYDPHLTLVEAVTVQVLGPARLELLPPDESGTAGVRLLSGRITVWSNGKPAARLRVAAGDDQGVLILDDPDATAGIEVQRVLRPGMDPRQEPPLVLADLYAQFGELSWQASDGQIMQLSSQGHLPLDGRPVPPAPPPAGEAGAEAAGAAGGSGPLLPAWMTSRSLNPVDKRGAEFVQLHLARPDRPVSLGLRELLDDRRVEVRLLAMQGLAEIGEFDVFPGLLNDAAHRALWNKAVESLRAQLAQASQTAVAIYDAFARARGQKAQLLFRMLYGYSDEQLAAGGAAELVDALEHEDLDARVLAHWNLREITGASLYYEPYANAKKREQSVRQWRERLERGEVVRKTPARS